MISTKYSVKTGSANRTDEIASKFFKLKVAVAMLGGRRSYLVPQILSELNVLDKFYTDAYVGNKIILKKIILIAYAVTKKKALLKLLGRQNVKIHNDKVVSFDFLGLWYSISIKNNLNNIVELEAIYLKGAERFTSGIIKSLSNNASVFWCFSGSSLELMNECNTRGIKCILDQISYPNNLENSLVMTEYDLSKDWIDSCDAVPILKSLAYRETKEWGLAEKIVAGSEFVKSGLVSSGVHPEKICVIPSGVDVDKYNPFSKDEYSGLRKLRILFVGRVSILKGAQYLLRALDLIDCESVEVRMVGDIKLAGSVVEKYKDRVDFVGHVPKIELAQHYEWADVFCFPSIMEGSAEVVYEALACGLPVITTHNSGSVVRDGVDGFLLPIRDDAALAERIMLYTCRPELLSEHRANIIRDRSRVDISSYKAGVKCLLDSLL